jgi:hypothetical protein
MDRTTSPRPPTAARPTPVHSRPGQEAAQLTFYQQLCKFSHRAGVAHGEGKPFLRGFADAWRQTFGPR